MTNAKPCPKCGESAGVVPIMYGYPTGEAMDEARRGNIGLGGCVVGGLDPQMTCSRCEIAFEFENPGLAPP